MATERKTYIKSIAINHLWGKRNLLWENLNPDVNILVGINGSGKTTLLDMLYAYCNNDSKQLKRYNAEMQCFPHREDLLPMSYIRSYDVPVADKRKTESPLMQELNKVVIQNKEGVSLFNYRMRIWDYPESEAEIRKNIDELFNVIDELFADTQKKVIFSKGNTSALMFRQGEDELALEQLSTGEKQLLLILIKVFLQDKRPSILLMDEPEMSLHISWQQKLIGCLRRLNPNCQIIMSTHSPSIFSKGWGNKLTFIEDLY